MRKPLLIAFAIILSLTACTNRPVFWLPPEIFNPDPEPVEECKHINLKDVSAWFDGVDSGHYPKIGICADCGEEITRESIEIGTADQLLTLGNDLSANNEIGYYTISIIDDIDMTGKTWPYIFLDGSKTPYNKKNFVINGNGHSIKGLTINDNDLTITDIRGIGLISRTWSAVTLEINDLTLIDAHITASTGNDGTRPSLGGFVGWIEANDYVKLSNCHVIESEFSGGHRAGGIYGYAAGWDEDGPVLTDIEIKECSVEDTNFSLTKASVGGIIGHAGGNGNTKIYVSDTFVTGCTISSEDGDDRIGNILGTNGIGQTELTSVTFSGNTLNGNSSDKYCGRDAFGETGSLTIK